MRIINAQLRYYLHLDPDSLTDEEWSARWNELIYVREQEARANKAK